ncbi:YqaE/Pmp3 family membrane protein [Flavobacterium frigidarium]|uniref:YqaE/Pmp3 family membrane protein n=1 Tax=Flavobacterium frigidarium TaxID=99286 RepID=UPI00047B391D|nr:YqaE/Pmp3 family membrane protein [Flavobacterium frigidarium]
MLIIAIIFPTLSFFLRGKILTAILCLLLQITIIGWIPASIWAVLSLQDARAEKRNKKLIKAMNKK